MRVIRVRLERFRGFAEMVMLPGSHAAVVGEPRAGRTDLITALRRVLDPRSTGSRPNLFDVHRPRRPSSDEQPEQLTEVEVTLVDLDPAVEQDLDDRLEAINLETGLPADKADADDAVMGLRLCYRLRYDEVTDTAEHWVEYPATGIRVPRPERELVGAW